MAFEPLLYMIIGGCIGGLLGWQMARSKFQNTIQEMVEERLEALRDKIEKRTRSRLEVDLRDELTSAVRRDLVTELTKEAEIEAKAAAKALTKDAEKEAETLRTEAEIEARRFLLEARDEAESELKSRRQELQKVEDRLSKREDNLDEKDRRMSEREQEVQKRASTLGEQVASLAKQREKVAEKESELSKSLEAIAGMTADDARELLKSQLIEQAEMEATEKIRLIEEETKEEAEKRAQKILGVACQRYAGEYASERTVNVVSLPNDSMKGRIIGREGRNIRALEAATGVDVIIDDTPEVVVISSFDPVRREIARRAMEKLLSDGRIHPSRIEELVERADQEVAQVIKESGQKAALELGIHGMHPELLKYVGQLKFRTSYGQNMWSHSIEVGFLCGLMASELGVDVADARRAGLLHDIGKALTHERQESHALVGAEIAARYGEKEIVRNAIAAHHNDEPQNSVIAHLVIAADALSGARPGARREILGTYVKRLEDLERISSSFEGVQKSYAIQAGREIRVLVEHGKVDDDGAFALSREIARKIEDELTYPGQIKVTVIRETRATGYAK